MVPSCAWSEDYGRYALLTFPVHVTGWLHDSLATAALLNAVGLGPALAAAAPGAAPALTAAAKWILKDGLGAAGRLVVAGRVAGVLDASPRQWRLYGSMASLLGGALEIATTFSPPQAFLPLAAGGTALKACGKAVAAPSHAALMAHFATYAAAESPAHSAPASTGPRNLGALTAKEEVQEVAAQLTGLAVSVAVLTWLGPASNDSPTLVATCWAAAATSHFLLRCTALQGIRFKSLNARRAMTAAIAHAIERTEAPPSEWASIRALNANEPLLTPDWALPTHLHLGCGVGAAVAGAAEAHAKASPQNAAAADVDAFLTWSCSASGGPLAGSPFLVTWHGREAWVVFTQAATSADALRAVWLATRLTVGADAAETASCLTPQGRERLCAAVADMDARFPSFRDALEAEGWDTGPLLPSPSVAPRLVHASPRSDGAAAAQDA